MKWLKLFKESFSKEEYYYRSDEDGENFMELIKDYSIDPDNIKKPFLDFPLDQFLELRTRRINSQS